MIFLSDARLRVTTRFCVSFSQCLLALSRSDVEIFSHKIVSSARLDMDASLRASIGSIFHSAPHTNQTELPVSRWQASACQLESSLILPVETPTPGVGTSRKIACDLDTWEEKLC